MVQIEAGRSKLIGKIDEITSTSGVDVKKNIIRGAKKDDQC